MRNKNNIDARDQALIRHVERATRAQGVSLLVEIKRQVRRVLVAIQRVDGSVETLAREMSRRRRGTPGKQPCDHDA